MRALQAIEYSTLYTNRQILPAAGISAAAWAIMFGGGVADFFIAFATAIVAELLTQWMTKRQVHGYMATLLCAVLYRQSCRSWYVTHCKRVRRRRALQAL